MTRQSCELQVGSCTVPAQLTDESAGGFSVLVRHPPELKLNQTIRLFRDDDWFHVRVVYVQEVIPKAKPAADANVAPPLPLEADRAEPGAWVRLGLRRLGDAELPDAAGASLLVNTLRFRLSHWKSLGITEMIVYGMLLAVMIVAIPLGMTTFGRRVGLLKTEGHPKRTVPTADATASGKSPVGRPADSGAARSPFIDDRAPTFPAGGAPRDAMLHLPGPAPFALPDVIDRLQLTLDQQKRIEQLIEAVSDALRKLEQQLSGTQRHEMSRQRAALLDLARGQALEILTEQQRAEWNKLSGEPQ